MGHTKETVNSNKIQEEILASTSIWIFGYGSLVWKTGFQYSSKKCGYIKGYARKFYQGSTKHRGTMEKPGRVATLVKESEGKVWGVCFNVRGRKQIHEAMEHLGLRECVLGGYEILSLKFYDSDGVFTEDAVVFIALPSNPLYFGNCSNEQMAEQIISCRGHSGYNVEYITKLADFFKRYIPEETDPHLFAIDRMIREMLSVKGIPLHTFYCENNLNVTPVKNDTMSADLVPHRYFYIKNLFIAIFTKLSLIIQDFIKI